LIPTLKLRLASPALLIDIGGLEELKGIELADRIRIGALTTHAELLASEPLRKILPIFHQTAELISDPQVRNRGTIGGSLSNADPAADWPAVAIAVKAELELAGPAGRRHVAAKDFFIDIMTTALDPDEVLVALNIPRPKPGAQFRYRKIRHPASGYAVVGVAVALCLQDSIVSEATIGITGATGRAFAAEAASTHLIGKPLSSQTITSAALLASEQAECLSDHYASADYRKHLVKTEIIRALASLSTV
jgi:carbon-monoxide dehydrogenase medium subunit